MNLTDWEGVRFGNDRITELQAHLTKLENENRMLRAQYTAARALLQHVLIDSPIAARINATKGNEDAVSRTLVAGIDLVSKRIELLERDAWTQTTNQVRHFVDVASNPATIINHDFIATWLTRFKKALDGRVEI